MPEHLYTGPSGLYPHHKDAQSVPIGAVEPGDVRDTGEPLDPAWLPVEGNEDLRALLLARREEERKAAEPDAGTDGEMEGESGSGDENAGSPPLPRRTRRTTPPDETPGGQAAGTEA